MQFVTDDDKDEDDSGDDNRADDWWDKRCFIDVGLSLTTLMFYFSYEVFYLKH